MRLMFESIRYKNVFSTGNKWIEIPLNAHSTVLIIGKNGQGKSTVLDALTFVLYGKAFRKIKKDQLVNSINKKGLVVEVEFSIGSNNYKIVRGISPNKLEVYVDGVLRDQEASVKDSQNYIENSILKMNEKTFRQIVILGSTQYVPFMKLTTADRRSVVENLLDIEIFSYMNTVIKSRTVDLKSRHITVENELKILNNSLELEERHIKEVRSKDSSVLEKNIKRLSELKKLIDNEVNAISSAEELIEEKRKDMSSLLSVNSEIQSIVKNQGALIGESKSITKHVTFFRDNDSCPSCEQVISKELKEEKISSGDKEVAEIRITMDELEQDRILLIEKLNILKSIEDEIDKLRNDITSSNSNKNSYMREAKNLIDDNKVIERDLERNDDDDNIDYLKEEISIKSKERSEILKKGNHHSAILNLIKDGGIKTKIIKTYIPVINMLIRKYLDILEFSVEFSFDETFNETIKSRGRDVFSYANFSEGEKLRIDLCLLFTWREISRMKNSASTNLIFFDEIGSNSLDESGVDAFMRIIDSEENQNVFVISHADGMTEKFKNILEFKKIGNFTTMNINNS